MQYTKKETRINIFLSQPLCPFKNPVKDAVYLVLFFFYVDMFKKYIKRAFRNPPPPHLLSLTIKINSYILNIFNFNFTVLLLRLIFLKNVLHNILIKAFLVQTILRLCILYLRKKRK